jgi:hypothetical protein
MVVGWDEDAERSPGRALAREGWDVVHHGDAGVAFPQIRRAKPAVVVLRAFVASNGGLALLQRLRGSSHTALIPVIALLDTIGTGRDEFRRWGAQACLEGDITDEHVCAEVRKHAGISARVTQVPEPILAGPERLQALQKSGLLDTAPEEMFDRVTRLVARLLDVPTVLMSLVDSHRQFFKSQVGLSAHLARTRETPLSHSFCQWVVADHDELVVPDARYHPLLRMSPATSAFNVIAYAGVPLHAGSREPIGSFCAMDTRPRFWEKTDLASLRDAATMIEGITVLRQGARLPLVSVEELRQTAHATGRAVDASVRLLKRGGAKLSATEVRGLVELTGELGRQLADVSAAMN